jgi:hypothetical protein
MNFGITFDLNLTSFEISAFCKGNPTKVMLHNILPKTIYKYHNISSLQKKKLIFSKFYFLFYKVFWFTLHCINP